MFLFFYSNNHISLKILCDSKSCSKIVSQLSIVLFNMSKSKLLTGAPIDEDGISDSLNAKVLLAIFSIGALIVLIGIIGNIALIVTYKRKGLNTRFKQLVVTLATFDLIFLLVIPSVPATFYFVSTQQTNAVLVLFNIAYIVSYTSFKGSIFTTMAITAERYLVDCKSVNTNK